MTMYKTYRFYWGVALLVAPLLATIGTAKADNPLDPNNLRLDQLQVIGSHNSYHSGVEPGILSRIQQISAALAKLLDYKHPPLSTQLDRGIRQVELDIYADSHGGRFSNPHNPYAPTEKWPLPPAEAALMRQPGFKVMHIPDIDQHANCQPLKACLENIRNWSDAHPHHIPVFVILEIEQSNDLPGATPVELFNARTFNNLDATIRSIFSIHNLLTPDDVRGNATTLSEAVQAHGWPTLAQSRGKVIFLLDQRSNGPLYLEGHKDLRGRVAFTNADPSAPDAAFTELNDGPVSQITKLVRKHLLVRTRADVNTAEAREGDPARQNAMLASGAQIISTDYPNSEPARWSGYRVGFPAGGSVRCNPVTSPTGCVSRLIDASDAQKLHLRRVVMVMRHGIRSALLGQEPATATVNGGWPKWEVAPGDLTPHGATGMRALGQFERQWLSENGLISNSGCPSSEKIAMRSNSERRTIASAHAFANGFAPTCSITIAHQPEGTADPLFSPLEADPARFDMRTIISQLPDANEMFAPHKDMLNALSNIVRCTTGSCDFLTAPSHIEAGSTNHELTLSGPIRDASSIAEALMLAYLDGKPEISSFSGKRIDATTLGPLSALHAAMLETIVRPPATGEPLSRNLRQRIITDLTEKNGPDYRLYVGHDDTIAPLLGLLDAHIQAPGYAADEIPVGSALGFALYDNDAGATFVRVFFQSQTPQDLRTTPETAWPSLSFPSIPICKADTHLCTIDELLFALKSTQSRKQSLSDIGQK